MRLLLYRKLEFPQRPHGDEDRWPAPDAVVETVIRENLDSLLDNVAACLDCPEPAIHDLVVSIVESTIDRKSRL